MVGVRHVKLERGVIVIHEQVRAQIVARSVVHLFCPESKRESKARLFRCTGKAEVRRLLAGLCMEGFNLNLLLVGGVAFCWGHGNEQRPGSIVMQPLCFVFAASRFCVDWRCV